jgi:hypothetical protein
MNGSRKERRQRREKHGAWLAGRERDAAWGEDRSSTVGFFQALSGGWKKNQ